MTALMTLSDSAIRHTPPDVGEIVARSIGRPPDHNGPRVFLYLGGTPRGDDARPGELHLSSTWPGRVVSGDSWILCPRRVAGPSPAVRTGRQPSAGEGPAGLRPQRGAVRPRRRHRHGDGG